MGRMATSTQSMRSLRAVAGVLALGLAAAGAAGCGGSTSASTAAAKPPARYDAPAKADPPRPAPDFALRNHEGKLVRLSQFRGKAVLLTFIYDHCPDTCPLIVGNLHSSLAQLGPKARNVQIVAVSVDPKGDTPQTVKAFLTAHEMTGRMQYLIGSKRQLAPVWRAYGIQVEADPESREVGHSASVLGITGKGQTAVLYPANFKPAWVVHDVPVLAAR
jgi:protein SCO1/2